MALLRKSCVDTSLEYSKWQLHSKPQAIGGSCEVDLIKHKSGQETNVPAVSSHRHKLGHPPSLYPHSWRSCPGSQRSLGSHSGPLPKHGNKETKTFYYLTQVYKGPHLDNIPCCIATNIHIISSLN